MGILEHRHSSPRRHGPQEMASLPIPDELLPEIFLHLPTPADLVRASAASSPTGPSSGGKAAALVADFSLSFLPAPSSDWTISDICDGRVLLGRRDYAEMVVCDPLHQRHLLLPPIPEFDEWVRSVDKPRTSGLQFFLVGGDEEASEETFFRVIYATCSQHKEAVFVFSSSTGQWRATPSTVRLDFSGWLEYAYGCLYKVTKCSQKLQVLDTRSMEFSHIDLPSEARARGSSHVHIAIVEAGESIIRMFALPDQTSDLSYFVRPNNGGSSSQWQLEKTISLDSSQYSFPESSSQRKLYLRHRGSPSTDAGLLSMDVKTFRLERVFGSNYNMLCPWAYNNFPPFLSTPTVAFPLLATRLRRKLWNKAVLQAQAHSHHCQNSDAVNAGGQAVLRISDASRQLTTG